MTVLVSDDDSGRLDYFDRHRLEHGLLEPGCCTARETELRLQFRCTANGNELFLQSTCGWVTINLITYHTLVLGTKSINTTNTIQFIVSIDTPCQKD